jgi:hypothetical protein
MILMRFSDLGLGSWDLGLGTYLGYGYFAEYNVRFGVHSSENTSVFI